MPPPSLPVTTLPPICAPIGSTKWIPVPALSVTRLRQMRMRQDVATIPPPPFVWIELPAISTWLQPARCSPPALLPPIIDFCTRREQLRHVMAQPLPEMTHSCRLTEASTAEIPPPRTTMPLSQTAEPS